MEKKLNRKCPFQTKRINSIKDDFGEIKEMEEIEFKDCLKFNCPAYSDICENSKGLWCIRFYPSNKGFI